MCSLSLPTLELGTGLSRTYFHFWHHSKLNFPITFRTNLIGTTDFEYFEWDGEHYLVLVQVHSAGKNARISTIRTFKEQKCQNSSPLKAESFLNNQFLLQILTIMAAQQMLVLMNNLNVINKTWVLGNKP